MFWLTGIVLVCFCRGECRWCLFTSWNLYVLTWLVCVYICLFFFLLSFCKAAFVLFSFVTIWLTIVLVTWLLISSILFVIRILFSVILFLFFVVRSRIKVLSSSILLFVVCRSFRRFVFYSAIGVIIFLIKSVICFDFPLISLWLLWGCIILGFSWWFVIFAFFAECQILSGDFFCGVNSTISIIFTLELFWEGI